METHSRLIAVDCNDRFQAEPQVCDALVSAVCAYPIRGGGTVSLVDAGP